MCMQQNLSFLSPPKKKKKWSNLGHVWFARFLSLITQFSSPITHFCWDPHYFCLFGFVFLFHFPSLITQKNELEWVKMKIVFRSFQIMSYEIFWQCCNSLEPSAREVMVTNGHLIVFTLSFNTFPLFLSFTPISLFIFTQELYFCFRNVRKIFSYLLYS